jgi:hypothetical protein
LSNIDLLKGWGTEKEAGSDDVSSREPGLASSSSSLVVGDGSRLPRAGWCHDDNERDKDIGKGSGSGDVRRQEGGGGVKNGASGRIGSGRPGRQKKWNMMDKCED